MRPLFRVLSVTIPGDGGGGIPCLGDYKGVGGRGLELPSPLPRYFSPSPQPYSPSHHPFFPSPFPPFHGYHPFHPCHPTTVTTPTVPQAYYKLSLIYHPDKNPADLAADAKFKEISEAYQVPSVTWPVGLLGCPPS